MKSIKSILSVAVLGVALLCSCEQSPKYVFFMIGDGMGINQARATEIYNEAKGYEDPSVNFFNFPVRSFFNTHCTTTLVTDSAAAGTALSVGEKTYYGAMGVGEDKQPLQTIAEKAIAAGYGAGVVTGVGVNHATPAAFYAHTDNRNNYDVIAQQLFESGLSFAAGGGFNVERNKKTAADYVEDAKAAGWEVYQGKDSFANLSSKGKVLCLGDDIKKDVLKYAIDQQESDTKLTDFTKAAVDHLYANHKNGFFLLVEGGNIDHACHDNDGATVFEDVNDFARAIDVVLDFYKKHPKQTLIIVTADHETGGLMLGSGKYSMDPKQLTYQKMSEGVLSSKIQAMANQPEPASWEEVKAVLSDALGLWNEVKVDPKTEEHFYDLYVRIFKQKMALNAYAWYSLNSALASDAVEYVNKVAGFGWSFEPHSGSPLGVYAIGAGAEEFASVKENSDVPNVIAKVAKYTK
ncbi:MAG: alkaline phosphatase [Bacteroidales bacterium]|nr:alkaline phosphatase [Bacteroidales bacterium]